MYCKEQHGYTELRLSLKLRHSELYCILHPPGKIKTHHHLPRYVAGRRQLLTVDVEFDVPGVTFAWLSDFFMFSHKLFGR